MSWVCLECGQRNVNWAAECGRCEKANSSLPAPPKELGFYWVRWRGKMTVGEWDGACWSLLGDERPHWPSEGIAALSEPLVPPPAEED